MWITIAMVYYLHISNYHNDAVWIVTYYQLKYMHYHVILMISISLIIIYMCSLFDATISYLYASYPTM